MLPCICVLSVSYCICHCILTVLPFAAFVAESETREFVRPAPAVRLATSHSPDVSQQQLQLSNPNVNPPSPAVSQQRSLLRYPFFDQQSEKVPQQQPKQTIPCTCPILVIYIICIIINVHSTVEKFVINRWWIS